MLKESEIMSTWTRDTVRPLVCISCLAYNHENFISECLDGLLSQKTDFAFEISVHDDCSTDNTTSILRSYAEKYPHIIKPVFETENRYSKRDGSLQRVVDAHLHGKYIAFCECDDVWLDPHKLQMQVDLLEGNDKLSLVLSDGYQGIATDSSKNTVINPYGLSEDGIVDFKTVAVAKKVVPTCSMIMPASVYFSMPKLSNPPAGDIPLRFWCAVSGEMYYIAKPLVFYRNLSGPTSFGARLRNDRKYSREVYINFCDYYDAFDEYTDYMYTDIMRYLKGKEEFHYFCREMEIRKALHSDYYINNREELSITVKMKLYFKLFFPHIYRSMRFLRNEYLKRLVWKQSNVSN